MKVYRILLLCCVCFASQLLAGPIRLEVDASDAPRRIFHSKMIFPVQAGPVTLFFPKWFPGTHAPTGQITDMVGLRMKVNGGELRWNRDPVDPFAFHCVVPAGVSELEVAFDFVTPTDRQTRHHPSAASEYCGMISWTSLLLYPAGKPVDQLMYSASLRLPTGWKYGTALKSVSESQSGIEFAQVSLYTLIDSPVVAGANFRTIELNPGSTAPYFMDLAADSESALQMKPNVMTGFQNLVPEVETLFGARHLRQYHFLVALSDPLEGDAVEHHESSDNRPPERMFLDDEPYLYWADTLPHELIHSWIGKYRRPAGLNTKDYQEPVHSELLWVYEGLTNYLGYVLAARSGLFSPEDFRGAAAWMAGDQDHRPGRSWKPLLDTSAGIQSVIDASSEWKSWRRGTDYYNEGFLIWLEVDTILRQKSGGRASLDDFCRDFFGGTSGAPEVKPFTLDELVEALNRIVPYDWKQHFATRVEAVNSSAPLAGLEHSGWRLAYGDSATTYHKAAQKVDKKIDLRYSIGMILDDKGALEDVLPGSAAAKAGVAPGMQLLGINGRHWSQTLLEEAVAGSTNSHKPIELLVENGGFYKILPVDYHEGARYPYLQRIENTEDVLSRIIAPHRPSAKPK